MRNIWIIFKREFSSYFNSTIAYIFIVVFLLLNCGLFMNFFFIGGQIEMRSFFGTLPLFLIFFIPAITMRLWAEEKKLGTIEMLMTLPMKNSQIVLGKFLASYLFFLIALSGTLTIPIMLMILGKPDLGAIVCGYIGSALLGAFYLSVGMFISGLCKDQIVAFILSMLFCFFFFIVGVEAVSMTIEGWIGGLGHFLQKYIGLMKHFEGIERGVLDIRNIVYFFLMSTLFLVLNTYSLEGRKY